MVTAIAAITRTWFTILTKHEIDLESLAARQPECQRAA